MNIVHVASEMVPFAKTGGLSDVVGSLCGAIEGIGHEVSVFLPRYKRINISKEKLEIVIPKIEISLGQHKESGRVLFKKLPSGVEAYFIDCPKFFDRDELYGTSLGDYGDNDKRFAFFQRAVIKAIEKLKLNPDILHCHDWQTGLIPVYLKTLNARTACFKKTKTVFTIHNLAYQGNFPPDSLGVTGLDWNLFKFEMLEFYGKVSFLKGGLVFSDAITTVSNKYSEEIQTKEFGCGLEGVLQKRRDSLSGIVNGIDLKEWDPEEDSDIKANYGIDSIEQKKINKTELQNENGFKGDQKVPVLGFISRLVDQKGLDIFVGALERLAKRNIQVVLLGTGEEKYHRLLRDIAKKNKKWLGVHILFDPKMAKRIYAGSDMLIVPSYYEPCGLGQMIALRYGTIPVVRATGGLADTIQEFNLQSEAGNGFVFKEYKAETLLDAIERAISVFKKEKLRKKIIKNGMKSDFSWTASAKKYIDLYESTQEKSIKIKEG